jgi:hypothetical protein
MIRAAACSSAGCWPVCVAAARADADQLARMVAWPPAAASRGLAPATRWSLFVFDTLARNQSPSLLGDAPSQAVADRVHRVWVDFITCGNPGWAPYDTATCTTGLLTETITPVDDPGADERPSGKASADCADGRAWSRSPARDSGLRLDSLGRLRAGLGRSCGRSCVYSVRPVRGARCTGPLLG